MRRWLLTLGMVALCVGRLGADLTITTALEGPMMALAGGNASPKFVTRIKGDKSRTDVEMGDQTTGMLIDLGTKQAILLNHGQKTAQFIAPPTGTVPPISGLKFQTTVKPPGKKREISGQQCDEFTIAMNMDMSALGTGPAAKPEAAAMLKGVRMTMTGFVWVAKDAPGSSEYLAFQTRAAKLAVATMSTAGGGLPNGMEQLLMGFSEAPGIPYLTELTLGVEGSGPMVEMMKQMSGQMKVVSRVASVSVDALQDTIFRVPDDYKVIKP